jgi:hypothetical protein
MHNGGGHTGAPPAEVLGCAGTSDRIHGGNGARAPEAGPPDRKDGRMARKPNFNFQKRQKELEKQKKKEEKAERKRQRKETGETDELVLAADDPDLEALGVVVRGPDDDDDDDEDEDEDEERAG